MQIILDKWQVRVNGALLCLNMSIIIILNEFVIKYSERTENGYKALSYLHN